jgi:hypothetical protein
VDGLDCNGAVLGLTNGFPALSQQLPQQNCTIAIFALRNPAVQPPTTTLQTSLIKTPSHPSPGLVNSH